MRIIQERLERENDVTVVQTAPTVTYEICMTDGKTRVIESPSELPDASKIAEIREPHVNVQMILPAEHVGAVMQLSMDRRGRQKRTIRYHLPPLGSAGPATRIASHRA